MPKLEKSEMMVLDENKSDGDEKEPDTKFGAPRRRESSHSLNIHKMQQ